MFVIKRDGMAAGFTYTTTTFSPIGAEYNLFPTELRERVPNHEVSRI
jgi:hypothetical protein